MLSDRHREIHLRPNQLYRRVYDVDNKWVNKTVDIPFSKILSNNVLYLLSYTHTHTHKRIYIYGYKRIIIRICIVLFKGIRDLKDYTLYGSFFSLFRSVVPNSSCGYKCFTPFLLHGYFFLPFLYKFLHF